MTGKPYTVADLLEYREQPAEGVPEGAADEADLLETGRAELHSQLDQLELDTPAEELAAWQRAFE